MSQFATASSWANLETFSRALASSSQPAIVWYGLNGERVELSGKVLENWIAKSANLFVDELDAAHGDVLTLHAPPHWRSIAAALGALRAGCRLSTREDSAFWLGFDHDSAAERAEVAIYMGRSALAMAYDGDAQDFPEGSVDYCAEIRSFGDVFDPLDSVPSSHVVSDSSDEAKESEWTLRSWLQRAAHWADDLHDVREQGIALTAPTENLTADFLAWCCGVMASGHTLVLVDGSVASNEERMESITRDERATRSVPGPR
ncbi:TIGR03089 family protein [Kocuria massiliensis]|uniref:TIGR03089 family protein n=1 Tax=Kocuria massiliensis TaxID=1926282 RepID=UPI000A1CD99F|nr:TIGR03089 family protein [Kocuria massiliensis]